VDTTAIVHMVYFKGEPGHGDVFYVRSKDWGMTFSSPMRVNSEPGTAVATGTIRGAPCPREELSGARCLEWVHPVFS